MPDISFNTEAKEQRQPNIGVEIALFRNELEAGRYDEARKTTTQLLSFSTDVLFLRSIREKLCFNAYTYFTGLARKDRASAEKLAVQFEDLGWRYWLV
jgi:hypothetical protein